MRVMNNITNLELIRDYIKTPLKVGEHIPYEDLKLVYIEKNISAGKASNIFNCCVDKIYSELSYHNLHKTKEQINEARRECWKKKTPEEIELINAKIKKSIDAIPEDIKKASYRARSQKYHNKSEAEKRLIYEKQKMTNKNKSQQEKELRTLRYRQTLQNKSEDERNARIEKLKTYWKNMSEEDKLKFKNKCKESWKNKSEDEQQLWKQQVSENSKKMWRERTVEQIEQTKQKMSDSAKQVRASVTDKQQKIRVEKFLKSYHNISEKDRLIRNLKISNNIKKYWNNLTPEQRYQRNLKAKITLESKSDLEKQEIQNKIYITKKRNKSFNVSNPEKIIYEKLCEVFEVKSQYKSESYPFNCDFYIPSIDLYIELNFHWTHGTEPFDCNNLKHQQILNMWKSKNSEFYKNAIYTWTDLDVRKRKCVIDNNLNYLSFYNEKDFYAWFETLQRKEI